MHQKLVPDPFLILVNSPKQVSHAENSFTNQIFGNRIISESFKKINFFFLSNRMSSVCHLYVTRMSFVCTCLLSLCHSYILECTRMSSVCHSCVLVCHPYVTRMYSYVLICHPYVTRMSLAYTRMSSVCQSYVLVCHSYVTRLWFYHEPFFSWS